MEIPVPPTVGGRLECRLVKEFFEENIIRAETKKLRSESGYDV